jgi:putative Ca2+/H+ antiporter (TMEM165/GDT1 family)
VRELALYVAAGVVYVAVGVAVPELLFSWVEGALFLLLAVWVLPALLGREP